MERERRSGDFRAAIQAMKRICVFCGSNRGDRPEYVQAARRLASTLVRRRLGIVFGGGCVGLMGALADAALAQGGEVIGVIPEALVAREVAHTRLTRMHTVRSMHERKALMAELSSAFVALPGGLGTFEELFEVLTWAQLGLHSKPCALLDVAGYFDPLLAMLDRSVSEGFVRPENRSLLIADSDPERLLDRIQARRPIAVEKWIDRDST